MSKVATRSQVSAEDYLAWEREQEGKHEFYEGTVYAMAGGSLRHNALCVRLGGVLDRTRITGCAVLSSDQRVGVASGTRYVYPDLTIVCGGVDVETNEVLKNPTVLVEVLSGETEQYDRGLKWTGYQTIPSLRDYVLVSQREARIEHFQRASDGRWTYRAASTGERITLSTGSVLDVDEIFAGVFELPGE